MNGRNFIEISKLGTYS